MYFTNTGIIYACVNMFKCSNDAPTSITLFDCSRYCKNINKTRTLFLSELPL